MLLAVQQSYQQVIFLYYFSDLNINRSILVYLIYNALSTKITTINTRISSVSDLDINSSLFEEMEVASATVSKPSQTCAHSTADQSNNTGDTAYPTSDPEPIATSEISDATFNISDRAIDVPAHIDER